MSKEMIDLQEQDDRYRYALEKLFELQGRKDVEIHEILRPELTEVQDFDYFYDDFRTILQEVRTRCDETDRILLNISSGTPGMKSGLLVLKTMGEFPAVLIQVTTPQKKMNEHQHKGYDVKLLWEMDEDNSPDFVNRCKEMECPSLSLMKNEEMIRKHIANYDYKAAVDTAESIPGAVDRPYYSLLKMGERRILLDLKGTDKWGKEAGYDGIPVKEGDKRRCFEFALNMKIKLEQNQYADFVLRITPLVVDLLKRVILKQTGLDVDDYTRVANGIEKWDKYKIIGTMVESAFNKAYADGFNYSKPLCSDHLVALLSVVCNDIAVNTLAEELRKVETEVRNETAHTMAGITDGYILKKTGFTSKQIMDKIMKLFSYSDLNAKSEFWNSYKLLNQEIERRLVSTF